MPSYGFTDTDLTSLRVGIPTADGFKSMTVDFIAKQTGMTLRRCERAIADLKAAGLLTSPSLANCSQMDAGLDWRQLKQYLTTCSIYLAWEPCSSLSGIKQVND